MSDLYTTKLREIVEVVLGRWPMNISLAEARGEPLARRVEFARLYEERLEPELERGLGRLAVQANWLIYAEAAKIISTEAVIDRSSIKVDGVVQKLDNLIVADGFQQLDGVRAADGSFDLEELRALRMGTSVSDQSS